MQHQYEPSPGPGAYTGVYYNSAFKRKLSMPAKYQRMGQGKSRWEERDKNFSEMRRQPGPNHYLKSVRNDSILRKKKFQPGKHGVSFDTVQVRGLENTTRDESSDEEISPGPGSYNSSLPFLVNKSFNKG